MPDPPAVGLNLRLARVLGKMRSSAILWKSAHPPIDGVGFSATVMPRGLIRDLKPDTTRITGRVDGERPYNGA
jgi:hypothetical protein